MAMYIHISLSEIQYMLSAGAQIDRLIQNSPTSRCLSANSKSDMVNKMVPPATVFPQDYDAL